LKIFNDLFQSRVFKTKRDSNILQNFGMKYLKRKSTSISISTSTIQNTNNNINNITEEINNNNNNNDINNTFENKEINKDLNKDKDKEIKFNYFYINKIDLSSNCISYIRINDDNGIKIDIDYYIKSGVFSSIFLEDFYRNKSEIEILSTEESKKLLSKSVSVSEKSLEKKNDLNTNSNINKDKDKDKSEATEILKDLKTIKIFYSINDNIEYDNPDEFTYSKDISTNFFLRKSSLKQARLYNIEKIEPENLTQNFFDDYIIENYIDGLLKEIRTKKDNLKILFEKEEIKSLEKNKLNYDNLNLGIKIYFSVFKNYLNLINIDFVDSSLLNVKEIEIFNYNFIRFIPNENNLRTYTPDNPNPFKLNNFENYFIELFKEKANDYNKDNDEGNDKLFIMIRNLKTRRVILKKSSGEIIEFKAEEINIKKDSLYKIKDLNGINLNNLNNNFNLNLNYSNCYVKVTNIPLVKLIPGKSFDLSNNIQKSFEESENNSINSNNNNTDNNYKIPFEYNEISKDSDIYMPNENEYKLKNKGNTYVSYNNNNDNHITKIYKINKDDNPNNDNSYINNNNLIDCSVKFDFDENYLNEINLNGLFSTKKDIDICVDISLLEKITQEKEMSLTKKYTEKELLLNDEEMILLQTMKFNYDTYYSLYFNNDSVKDCYRNLSDNEKEKIKLSINDDMKNINKISFYLESKELWEYIEVYIFYILLFIILSYFI
jgi:hypothetical protein